ncbi:MAG: response regulator [Rubrivivax sp.]
MRAREPGTGAGTEGPSLAPLQGLEVLLAEDNPLNQRVAVDLLSDVGVRVEVAANGQEAVQKALSASYDLVLMDMQMPVMDGLEATQALRALPELDGLPVVAMTANAMATDRERCLAAGMVDFVAKPIDPDLLFAALLRWAVPRRQARASQAHDAALVDGAARSAFVQGIPQARGAKGEEEVKGALGAQGAQGAQEVPEVQEVQNGQTPNDSAGGPPAFPLIAGLDVATGLRLVRGRADRYEALLRDFVADQAQTAGQIRELLARGDAAQAVICAHTLKGLAGHIGAPALAAAAAQVEQLLHRSGGLTEASAQGVMVGAAGALNALETVLVEQVRAIAAVLPAPRPAAADAASAPGLEGAAEAVDAPKKVDAHVLAEVCQAMLTSLRNDDGEAERLVRVHEALLQAAFPDGFAALRRAVCAFDSEAALALMDALMETPT